MRKINIQNNQLLKLMPWIVFILINLAIWTLSGIRPGGDASRFIDGANRLLSNQQLIGFQAGHYGYIVFVALIKLLGLGDIERVLFHVLVSGLALFSINKLGRLLAGPWVGFISAMLYALNIDVLRWNFYLLSDSLFTSGMIISSYFSFLAATADSKRKRYYFIAFVLTFLTATLRPDGSLLVLPIIVFLTMTFLANQPNPHRIGFLLLLFLIYFTMFAVPLQIGANQSTIYDNFSSGTVIWGDKDSAIQMPLWEEATNHSALDVLRYCSTNIISCLKLFGFRVGSMWLHTKPFYSQLHNLVYIFTLPLLYIAAAFGFIWSRKNSFSWMVLGILGMQTLITGLTIEDWDGRFLDHIFTLIVLFSAIGITAIIRSLGRKLHLLG